MACHAATALYNMLNHQEDANLCQYVASSASAPFWDTTLGFDLMFSGYDYGNIMDAAEAGDVKKLKPMLMQLFCAVSPLLSRFGSMEDFTNFKTAYVRWNTPSWKKRHESFFRLEWKWDKTNPLTRGAPFTAEGKEYNQKILQGVA